MRLIKRLNMVLLDVPPESSGIFSIIALVFSAASVVTAYITYSRQEKYYRNSLRPIAAIIFSDYENRLTIQVKNSGIGPMIIKKIETFKGDEIREYPIDWMPPGIPWANFQRDLDGFPLSAGETAILLDFHQQNSIALFDIIRDEMRQILMDLTMRVIYDDIYGERQPDCVRDLKWFGRTLRGVKRKYYRD